MNIIFDIVGARCCSRNDLLLEEVVCSDNFVPVSQSIDFFGVQLIDAGWNLCFLRLMMIVSPLLWTSKVASCCEQQVSVTREVSTKFPSYYSVINAQEST
jgi:hypothetical protein